MVLDTNLICVLIWVRRAQKPAVLRVFREEDNSRAAGPLPGTLHQLIPCRDILPWPRAPRLRLYQLNEYIHIYILYVYILDMNTRFEGKGKVSSQKWAGYPTHNAQATTTNYQ